MQVYGSHNIAVAFKKISFLATKMGLKPAQEPPVQSFPHRKVPICLILTTFWDKTTFGLIIR